MLDLLELFRPKTPNTTTYESGLAVGLSIERTYYSVMTATLLPPSKFLWTGVLTYCQPQILTFRASALVGTVKMPVTTFTTTWELDDGTSGVMVTRLLVYKIYLPLIS